MKIKVGILIFVILIVSDLFIGFQGHYNATTDNDHSLEVFKEYLNTVTFMDLLPTLIIAIGVFILIWKLIPG